MIIRPPRAPPVSILSRKKCEAKHNKKAWTKNLFYPHPYLCHWIILILRVFPLYSSLLFTSTCTIQKRPLSKNDQESAHTLQQLQHVSKDSANPCQPLWTDLKVPICYCSLILISLSQVCQLKPFLICKFFFQILLPLNQMLYAA